MTTVNTSSKSGAHLEDMALEVFLASAAEHEETVRDYLDEIKANSETRKKIREIQSLVAHMQSMEAKHGAALSQGTAEAGAQAEWGETLTRINTLIQSSPFIQAKIEHYQINHMPFDEVKTKLEGAASELGDIGQEMQQRMSHAVSLASRHYELGSTINKKFNETSSAIIRNI
jgi:hypothetical protein